MKEWYKSAAYCAPPPAQVNLDRITTDTVVLYLHVPPPGENTTIFFDPFSVDDLLPVEDNIEWAVKSLRSNHSVGPFSMRANHLQQWLQEAQNAEEEAAAANAEEAGDTDSVTETGVEAEAETDMAVMIETTEMVVTDTTVMEPPALSHFQKEVELVQAALQEWQLAE